MARALSIKREPLFREPSGIRKVQTETYETKIHTVYRVPRGQDLERAVERIAGWKPRAETVQIKLTKLAPDRNRVETVRYGHATLPDQSGDIRRELSILLFGETPRCKPLLEEGEDEEGEELDELTEELPSDWYVEIVAIEERRS